MEKKTITLISIFVVVIVAVLGVGLVAAFNGGHFGMGFEKFGNPKNMTQAQIQQMKDFNNKDQQPITDSEAIDFSFSQEIDNTVEAPVFKEDKNRAKDIVPYVDKEGKNYPDKLLYDFNNGAIRKVQ